MIKLWEVFLARPDCGEDVLISSPLQPLTDPGQDVSCERNKGILFS